MHTLFASIVSHIDKRMLLTDGYPCPSKSYRIQILRDIVVSTSMIREELLERFKDSIYKSVD